LQLTQALLTCEKPDAQVLQTLFAVHNVHDAILHGVQVIAPPKGTVKPALQAAHIFGYWQFMQLAILHDVQLPPNVEIVKFVAHCEQKLEVVAQVMQLGTLQSLHVRPFPDTTKKGGQDRQATVVQVWQNGPKSPQLVWESALMVRKRTMHACRMKKFVLFILNEISY
jgi:hypothetical protein